ncbi:MAG TPA: choice-of-anchor tandem repeat GloVer-containing protein [Terriglobales bacterium]|jgi:uncharacterized repeat protein (TIGR03803 family)|nr:choice-of-anchor tandem repeat GloVer-containing protein [Terriglobales bacterium]
MSKLNFCMRACVLFVLWATTTMTLPAQTFKSLDSFDNTNAAFPWATLLQANDGNFYGTTQNGGNTACNLGCGTIFRIAPNGKLTTSFSFNGTNGSQPIAGLVQAANGDFYGVTTTGGAYSLGTVFKFTPNGDLTTLYSFAAETGYNPMGTLVLASDGNFYGTASSGGPPTGDCKPSGCGTIFKITPKGKYTTIHHFNGLPDGGLPLATMIQAPDGKLYGTAAAYGNAGSYGTVFTITLKGKFTVIHQFNDTDGAYPFGGLILGTDGNFYGQTDLGGASQYGAFGTVYKMTRSGKVTTLHSFEQTDGDNPISDLVKGTDGNLYGTASYGGKYPNFGTVFKITSSGTFTTLHNFDSTDGSYPYAGLIQATNGKFYGATFAGGSSTACEFGCGTVFSLSVGLGPFVKTLPNSGKVGAAVRILGSDLTGVSSVTFNGTTAKFTVISKSELETSVPSGATTGTVEVKTTKNTLNSNVAFRVTK